MTGQVYDQCEYEGVNYVILGSVGETLPTAASFNIETADRCTGFHRGYIMYYAIVENQLLLKKMVVTTVALPPEINNIAPVGNPRDKQYSYLDLNYPVRFTGSITLGKDLIQEYKSHMGFQPAWSYAIVLRLKLTAGQVTTSSDQSAEYAKQREVEVPKFNAYRKKMQKDAEAYRRRQAMPSKAEQARKKKIQEEIEEKRTKNIAKLRLLTKIDGGKLVPRVRAGEGAMSGPPGETFNHCTSDEWNAEVRDNPRPTAEYVLNFLHHEGLRCLNDGQWYYLDLKAGTPAGAIARGQLEAFLRALPSLADLGNNANMSRVEVTEPFDGERGLISVYSGAKDANWCEWWEFFVGYDAAEKIWSAAEADFYTKEYIHRISGGQIPSLVHLEHRKVDQIAETLDRLKNAGEFKDDHKEGSDALARAAAIFHIAKEFTRVFEEVGTHFLCVGNWTFLCTNLMRLIWVGQDGLKWIYDNAWG